MNSLAKMTMMRSASEPETESRRRRDDRGRYAQGEYESPRMGYEGNTRNEYGAESRGGYRNEYRMGDDEEYRRKWTITENNRNRGGDYRSEYTNTYPVENGNSPMEGDPTKGPSRGSRQYEEMERTENRMNYEGNYGNGTFRGEDEGRRMIGYGGTESHYRYPERGDEMSHRSSQKERGYSHSDEVPELTKEKAKEWVKSMRPSDMNAKEKGERWSFDETTSILRQHGWQHDPVEWYAILHAMYYDYCKVAKKYGQGNNNEFYVDMAHAWLDDKDANEDKAALYYAKIAKH